MTRFRPCIDLHAGQVKQIVGGTLGSQDDDGLKTNHVSPLPATHFARLYRDHDALGAHVIMLGPGNEEAAREALREWPGRLQVGGGITDANANEWIENGAEKVRLLVDRLQNGGREMQFFGWLVGVGLGFKALLILCRLRRGVFKSKNFPSLLLLFRIGKRKNCGGYIPKIS